MSTDPQEQRSTAEARPHGVRLTICYDGTAYRGWQAQPNQPTVQTEIEAALRTMRVDASRLRGCSRTDTGVHARGQVASFNCDRLLPERSWRLALNGLLPDDIAITEAKQVDRRYNPRHDAKRKLYRYLITVGESRDPMTRRTAWQVGPPISRKDGPRPRPHRLDGYLDLDAMKDAAARMVGDHDFHAFRALSDTREHTRRVIFDMRLIDAYGGRPDMLAIEVEGNAFMKNMIRIIAGTLVDVGRHHFQPEHIDWLLSPEGRRHDAGPTAPGHGLTLEKIWLRHGDWRKDQRSSPAALEAAKEFDAAAAKDSSAPDHGEG